jgi:nicotinate-nucleotide adenylyltransferase
MRIAVFGGSFNPPHVGHAMVAAWLRWTDLVDEVWLLPASVHALDKDLPSFERRVSLCRALADDLGSYVRVEPVEGGLPTPSYTIDTLEVLARRHPGFAFRLVVGADILEQTHRWKQWPRIESRFTPIVVGRDGFDSPPDSVVFPAVSSTEIRRRLAANESVDHLLTSGVRALLSPGGPR